MIAIISPLLLPPGWTSCDISHGGMLPAVSGAGQQPHCGSQTVLEEEGSSHSAIRQSLSDEVRTRDLVLYSHSLLYMYTGMSLHSMCEQATTVYNTATVMSLHSMC